MHVADCFPLAYEPVSFPQIIRKIVANSFCLFNGGSQQSPHPAVSDPLDLAVAGLQSPPDSLILNVGKETRLFHIEAAGSCTAQDPPEDKGGSRCQSLSDIRHIIKSQTYPSGTIRSLKMRHHTRALAESASLAYDQQAQSAKASRCAFGNRLRLCKQIVFNRVEAQKVPDRIDFFCCQDLRGPGADSL